MPENPAPRADRRTARDHAPDAENPVEEARFHADEIIDHSRAYLRSDPHVVAGALAANGKKTFTLKEAEDAVKDFLSREIPVDGA